MRYKFILLMGVSGSGKTTVGKALARKLGWVFYDGDHFHSPDNIAKMRSGIPLDDRDRLPWLEKLRALVSTSLQDDKPGIIACSALKEQYRKILMHERDDILLVYLKGTYDLIWSRMADRPNHYMKPGMLKSQFDTLEEPENGLIIDISKPVSEIVTIIVEHVI